MSLITVATVFFIMVILSTVLSVVAPFERLYADRSYAVATNQLPTQSNIANGDDNMLQNCAQTAAGKHNQQPMECQQNSIQKDTVEKRGIALLTVIKQVQCIFVGPPSPGFINWCSPSAYIIHVSGNSPSPSSFQGSSAGTTIILGDGEYSVTESKPATPDTIEIIEEMSPDCSGSISLGESKTCIITNEVTPVPQS